MILGLLLQTKAAGEFACALSLHKPRFPSPKSGHLARTHVPKETTEYGIFEIMMVTKNLGDLGVLTIISISIYLTSKLSMW